MATTATVQDAEAKPVSPEPAERVTQPPQKDPKKVAAGRAGAAAKKARKERLLEEFRTAKESLNPQEPAEKPPSPQTAREPGGPERWTPWIIGGCLAGGLLACLAARQSLASPPAEKQQESPQPPPAPCRPMVDVHLDSRDPFHME